MKSCFIHTFLQLSDEVLLSYARKFHTPVLSCTQDERYFYCNSIKEAFLQKLEIPPDVGMTGKSGRNV